ncbi:circularly permuted type 2 ATP-grasp protein [Acidocella sp.]|uniref:circularly permuted type 2 ATP-grasp protein n=2 Tax=Acidocella sp. TaxID=50710 RepID=UPI00262ED3F9|nr:circularly permuted type 2 ATP-grasp protein [Acidocella sp.]
MRMFTIAAACDEMIDRQGRIRTPWLPIMGAARDIGPEELERRGAALNRQIGLAAPFGQPPRFTADPLPVPLTATEFATLEAGLKQRARLLSATLEDLYGPQTLLRGGHLPPALVLGDKHFLRPMHTRGPLPRPRLSLYAADVVRTPEGGFALLADHTGMIPGLGLALNLRRWSSGTVPELFRAGGLRSLRPAREMLVDHLHREAEGGIVAVLSAGAANGAEHDTVDDALLARALGLMLIEPGDLATRNGALHMKTLSGLLHVSTLLRGISGIDIDPLEQGGRPGLGIPGSFGAIRAGVLEMLNAPGSALLQSAALKPYLAGLFPALLAESPLLPDAPANARQTASKAPFTCRQGFTGLPMSLRLFAWHDGAEWQLLPGGLGVPLESPPLPGELPGIKDVWVLDAEEPRLIAGAAPAEPPERVKFLAAAHLPSRLADNLFWLGRSVERLESACRLLMLALPRLESGTSLPRDIAERALLARCLAQAGLLPPDIATASISGRLLRQTLTRRRPLAGLLKEVGRLIDASSERLSPSMLSTVRFALHQATEALPNEETALPTMLNFAATFAGIAAENMSREGGWLFLEMGRRLERGESMAEALAILLDAPPERLEPGMGLSIELADSVLSYDLRHAGILAPGPVLSMLLADLANPRALGFQAAALRACLERLGADDDAATAHLLMQDILNLAGQVRGLTPALASVAARLRTLSDRVHHRFFTLLPEAHALDDDELMDAAQ